MKILIVFFLICALLNIYLTTCIKYISLHIQNIQHASIDKRQYTKYIITIWIMNTNNIIFKPR